MSSAFGTSIDLCAACLFLKTINLLVVGSVLSGEEQYSLTRSRCKMPKTVRACSDMQRLHDEVPLLFVLLVLLHGNSRRDS